MSYVSGVSTAQMRLCIVAPCFSGLPTAGYHAVSVRNLQTRISPLAISYLLFWITPCIRLNSQIAAVQYGGGDVSPLSKLLLVQRKA